MLVTMKNTTINAQRPTMITKNQLNALSSSIGITCLLVACACTLLLSGSLTLNGAVLLDRVHAFDDERVFAVHIGALNRVTHRDICTSY